MTEFEWNYKDIICKNGSVADTFITNKWQCEVNTTLISANLTKKQKVQL